MATKKYYYAVKIGRNPGIYETWEDCKDQIMRVSNLYKKFLTYEEAEKYIQGEEDPPLMINTDTTNEDTLQAPEGTHLDIFTDGSFEKTSPFEEGRYSWAFAVYEKGELIHFDSAEGTNKEVLKHRNIAGEVEAVVNAITWAEGKCNSTTIHHDYTGLAYWPQGDWKAKNGFTQGYAEFVKPRSDWVKFNKVAAHSGLEGNELVDRLAGEALRVLKAV